MLLCRIQMSLMPLLTCVTSSSTSLVFVCCGAISGYGRDLFPCYVGEFAFPCFVFWIEKSPGVRWSSVNTEEDRVACRNLCLHAHSSACEQVGLSDSWCVRVVEQATNTVETLLRNYSSSSSSRNN